MKMRNWSGRSWRKGIIAGAVIMAAALSVSAAQVELSVKAGEPVMIAGKRNTAFIKVSLEGKPLPSGTRRTPANIAIVIDKSGSMSGDKIAEARRAAWLAVQRLSGDDIVSVLAYDNTVTVLVPATRVSDRDAIREGIDAITADGSTALFAGVSKGAEECRKFLDGNRVNRVILLSDGQANVGPSSPLELGRLGASLAREGLSVTTIGLGLGYNEDLMTELALKSDGNHAFVENADQLAKIFDAELGDVLSVVAQDVRVTIECATGVKPLRVLGRSAEITGRKVSLNMNQVIAGNEKYVLLEVEVPSGAAGSARSLASVNVSYDDMSSRSREHATGQLAIRFSGSRGEIEANRDRNVMVSATQQIHAEKTREAVKLRDEGRIAAAQKLMMEQAAVMDSAAVAYAAPELATEAANARTGAATIKDDEQWNQQRKGMRESEHKTREQQSY